MDNLFARFEEYSQIISEINTVLSKYIKDDDNFKFLVMVKNKTESISTFNLSQKEANYFLLNLAESFDHKTSAISDLVRN